MILFTLGDKKLHVIVVMCKRALRDVPLLLEKKYRTLRGKIIKMKASALFQNLMY